MVMGEGSICRALAKRMSLGAAILNVAGWCKCCYCIGLVCIVCAGLFLFLSFFSSVYNYTDCCLLPSTFDML